MPFEYQELRKLKDRLQLQFPLSGQELTTSLSLYGPLNNDPYKGDDAQKLTYLQQNLTAIQDSPVFKTNSYFKQFNGTDKKIYFPEFGLFLSFYLYPLSFSFSSKSFIISANNPSTSSDSESFFTTFPLRNIRPKPFPPAIP